MKILLFILSSIIFYNSPVLAVTIEEELPFTKEVESQYILAVNNGKIKILPAELRKSPKVLNIIGSVDDTDKDILTAAAVKFTDGQIESTPLRNYNKSPLNSGLTVLAEEQAAELANRLKVAQEQVANSEKEIESLTRDLRKKAGLDEVDAILDKIKLVEVEILELKNKINTQKKQ